MSANASSRTVSEDAGHDQAVHRRTALDKVDLELHRGEVLILVGENGQANPP